MIKQQVYLCDDVPLEIIVIDRNGKILRKEYLKWNGTTLRFVQFTPSQPKGDE